MPAVVDRKIGFHRPVPLVGNSYPDTIGQYLSKLGRKPEIWSIFVGFELDYPGKPGSTKPHTDYDLAVTKYGMDLLIGLQPSWGYSATGVPASPYAARWATFADIIAGVYDAPLTAIATHYAGLRKPDGTAPRCIWRQIWEGNQTFSVFFPADSPNKPANMQATGTNSSTGYPVTPGRPWSNDAGDPICASVAQYKAAWDHMADVIHAAASNNETAYVPGATDARAELDRGAAGATLANMLPTPSKIDNGGWDKYCGLDQVWISAGDTIQGFRPNDMTDADADARGMDRVTRGASAPAPATFALDLFKSLLPGKPLIVGEINACEPGDPKGSPKGPFNKAAWYTDLWALPSTFAPEITRICFFDAPGTRTTWPTDNAIPAYEAFVAGFTQRTASSTWAAPDPWVTPDDGDFVPADARWLDDEPIRGQGGAAGLFTTILRWLRTFTYRDGTGKVGLRAKAEGSTVALRATSGMGANASVAQYVPIVDLVAPAPVGGIRKMALSIGETGDTAKRLQVRSDGLFYWTGGSGSSDLQMSRSAAGTLLVAGASGGAATVQVDTVSVNVAKLVDRTTAPGSPGTGSAHFYVKDGAARLKTATSDVQLGRQPQAEALYGDWEEPFDLALVSASSAGPQTGAAGTALCALVSVSTARAFTSLATYIQLAGSGLSGCYLAAYLASTGALLAATDDRATSWQSTGYKAVSGANFTAAAALASAPAPVWLLAWYGAATAAPRFGGFGSSAAGSGSPIKRFGVLTGMTGAPPASIDVSAIAASGAAAWLAIK